MIQSAIRNLQMSDDPVPITVLGAGPIGLETALYARFLGHPVSVIERGDRVGANLRQWGHVRMFSPFGMNASALGVAATGAHDPQWKCPAADELLSGAEFCERYLAPLAETDLLADCFTFGSEVIAIGRSQMLKGEGVGDPRRGEDVFRLLLRHPEPIHSLVGNVPPCHSSLAGTLGTPQRAFPTGHLDGNESTAEAEVVIDCTGTYANHNWLGQGGVPAIGERSAENRIEYGLPDMLGVERDEYADRQVLVVGAGYSAATNVVELAKLADEHPSTRVTWLTRLSRATCSSGPIRRIENDRLPERDRLGAAANQLANDPTGPVRHLSVTGIHSIEWDQSTGQFEVTWSAENEVSGAVLEHRERFDRQWEHDDGCHVWMGARFSTGYGQFKLDGKTQLAHRVAWLWFTGSVADQVHHLCGVKACVNPEHLEAVNRKQHARRHRRIREQQN